MNQEYGFYHPDRGYWQTTNQPPKDILDSYPEGTPVPVAMNHATVIDGTFPHWQRVIPRIDAERSFGCFSPKFLNDFGKAAIDLYPEGKGGLSISANGDNPALIRFWGVDHAFGVLMPFLKYTEGNTLPAFLHAAPAMATAA
ncbi:MULTISPECIES: hypothetical protein [unclassified Rhizobium]|uniref:hypothetical protein n=1 Tax=unclassified Rhizobium TaxID=2613769 RepID=UPI0017858342|nr:MULTISPECIES: hypothetical protein [unclassified Rhizobium]MBD8687065.1 hypothetical protein [Rhizobium sp. CFBP 13644]MBD8691132.1 hypothetical protein [Rhizobium sp. CFBP 13717]